MNGIYKITNQTNGKIYIGSSSDIQKRWDQHRKSLNNYTHHNYKLQSDWMLHGSENFIFEILEEDVFNLIEQEEYYIRQYNFNQLYNVFRDAATTPSTKCRRLEPGEIT